jgi:hypothetical protein
MNFIVGSSGDGGCARFAILVGFSYDIPAYEAFWILPHVTRATSTPSRLNALCANKRPRVMLFLNAARKVNRTTQTSL